MIYFRLKRITEQLHVISARLLVRSGLPLHQRWLPLYHYLIQEGPHAVTDIATSIGLSHPAVLQFAQEMIEVGLLSGCAHLLKSYRVSGRKQCLPDLISVSL